DVEIANERQVQRMPLAIRAEAPFAATRLIAHGLRAHRGIIAQAERQEVRRAWQFAPRRIVRIHHGDSSSRSELRDQPGLRGEVLVHRTVVIKMIAGEVREHGGRERQPVDAMLIETVRRHLHGDRAHAPIGKQAQHALQLYRPRRGESRAARHRLAIAPREHAQRPDGRAAPLDIVEQMTQDADGRRLAIGAGDSDQSKGAPRLVVRNGRGERGGTTGVMDDDEWQIGMPPLFHDGCRRALRRCLRQELVPIPRDAAHGDEQRAGMHGSTVVGDTREFFRDGPGKVEELPGATERREHAGCGDRAHGVVASRTSVPLGAMAPACGVVPLAMPNPSGWTWNPAACRARTAARSVSPCTSGTTRADAGRAGLRGTGSESSTETGSESAGSPAPMSAGAIATDFPIESMEPGGASCAVSSRRSSAALRAAIAAWSTIFDTGAATMAPKMEFRGRSIFT